MRVVLCSVDAVVVSYQKYIQLWIKFNLHTYSWDDRKNTRGSWYCVEYSRNNGMCISCTRVNYWTIRNEELEAEERAKDVQDK